MKKKSLKKLAVMLNRNDGVSLIAIMTMLVIMSVMGGVFSSVMGRWKISAPTTINSTKALYLAETAAMFALQDAQNRFFSVDATDPSITPSIPPGAPLFPSATTGTRSTPYVVSSSSTETAEFWIERPFPSANNIDEFPAGTHRGNNDDDTTGEDDDGVDDDGDDSSNDPDPKLYTIIATGKVLIDGTTTTIAKRQIKIKATITDNSFAPIDPGVHTEGAINGTGTGTSITDGTKTVKYKGGADWNYADSPYDDDTGLVYKSAPVLDKGVFKALATDQAHYNSVDLTIDNFNNNYPEPATPSYYYYYNSPTDNIPNIIYLEGSTTDLTVLALRTAYGIYYVEGNVTLNANSVVNGIIICEGNVTLNGTATITGGIIQYGASNKIDDNGNPTTITIDASFFDALDKTIPIITVQLLQEAVSAN